MPFYIEKNNLPSWHTEPANYTLARLGMSSPSCSSAPRVATGNFFGYKNSYDVFVRADRPWMKPIPGYLDQNGYAFAFRNCCDYIDPTTISYSYSTGSTTKSFVNNGYGRLTHGSSTGNLFRENTQHLLLSLTGAGGGGSGSSGTVSGAGGGAGATAILVLDLTKVKNVEFVIGAGGQYGAKGTSASVNRHGTAGGNTSMKLTLNSGSKLTLTVEGGQPGLQYSSNNGGNTVGGTGGSKVYIYDNSGNATKTYTSSSFSGVNYIAVNSAGGQVSYPDTNGDGVIYLLSITAGGTGGPGGVLNSSSNITKPITPTATTYCTGVTYTPSAQTEVSHTAGLGFVAQYGGDGGYSVYGQGGVGSYEYRATYNDTLGTYTSLWSNATAPTGYGAGGAGDVFLVAIGKNGTSGADGVVHVLSYNSATSTPVEIDDGLGEVVTLGELKILVNNSVTVAAIETIDAGFGGNGPDPGYIKGDTFTNASYLKNDAGKIVPVIYKTTEGYSDPDLQETYYYIGQEYVSTLGGNYDKWRKIEEGTSSDMFTWTSEAKKYIYTNIVITNNRFNDSVLQKALTGTASISWSVIGRTSMDGMTTYSLAAGGATVPAPEGCTFVAVSSLQIKTMGLTTGRSPMVSAYGTISNNGKTLTIGIEQDAVPFATGSGNAEVLYTVMYQ